MSSENITGKLNDYYNEREYFRKKKEEYQNKYYHSEDKYLRLKRVCDKHGILGADDLSYLLDMIEEFVDSEYNTTIKEFF